MPNTTAAEGDLKGAVSLWARAAGSAERQGKEAGAHTLCLVGGLEGISNCWEGTWAALCSRYTGVNRE